MASTPRGARDKLSDALLSVVAKEEAAAQATAAAVGCVSAELEAALKLLPPPAAPPADEAELQAAVEAAKTAEPLPPDGQFPETWDASKTYHWSGAQDKATNKLPGHSARVQREMASFQAIVDLDQARIAVHDRPKCPASYTAVKVGWLKQLAMLLPREWTTAQVVERVIKPATAGRRCRFVELMSEGDVGEADLFGSHTWNAPFVDLVAAICHVATDAMYVWVDIFAVRCPPLAPRLFLTGFFFLLASTLHDPPLPAYARRCASGRATAPTSTSAPSSRRRAPSCCARDTWRRWRR